MKKILVLLITLGAFFASEQSFAQSNSIYEGTSSVSEELQAAYQYGYDIGYIFGFNNNQAGLQAALLNNTPPVVYGVSGSASQHRNMYRMGLQAGYQTGYGFYLSRDKEDPLFSIGVGDGEQ